MGFWQVECAEVNCGSEDPIWTNISDTAGCVVMCGCAAVCADDDQAAVQMFSLADATGIVQGCNDTAAICGPTPPGDLGSIAAVVDDLQLIFG